MADIRYVEPRLGKGQRLELRIHEGPFKGKYRTVIDELTDRMMLVEVPSVKKLYLPVGKGQPLFVEYREAGARYQFETVLIERDDLAEPPLLTLETPSRVKRIQLRDFLRVPCEISGLLVVESGRKKLNLPRVIKGTIVDISAGGVKFRSPLEVPPNTPVSLHFEIPEVKMRFDEVQGVIIRSEKKQLEEAAYLAVEFEGLLDEYKKVLLRYTYRRQVELKKRNENDSR